MIRVIQCEGGCRYPAKTLTLHIDPDEAVKRIYAAFADVRQSNGESKESFAKKQKMRGITAPAREVPLD